MTWSTEQELTGRSIGSFLDDLASAAPTPGGGAAAALAGALAAALVSMVANLTVGRPRYAAVDDAMRSILAKAERTRQELIRIADDDARAYAAVAAAYRMPRSTVDERAARTAAVQDALALAAGPPTDALDVCRGLVTLCLQVAAHGNSNVASDAGIAAELAGAGVRCSALNIRVNLGELKNQDIVDRYEAKIAAAEAGLADDLDRVAALVRAKIARKAIG